MAEILRYKKYTTGGFDIGWIGSSQLGHRYVDELYGIHIGSGLPPDYLHRPLCRGLPHRQLKVRHPPGEALSPHPAIVLL